MIEKPRYSHATKIAQKTLKEAQIVNPPVDINIVLKNLGINLLPYPFPEKISAILLKENDMLVVGVNKAHCSYMNTAIAMELSSTEKKVISL